MFDRLQRRNNSHSGFPTVRNNEATHLVWERGKTEAVGCQGRAETGRKPPQGKAAASRTTSLGGAIMCAIFIMVRQALSHKMIFAISYLSLGF